MLQFASQAAGSQGLATYVQQISEAAIKVILLPMRQTMRSGDCTLRSSDGHHPCERHARWCRPLCVCCHARTCVSRPHSHSSTAAAHQRSIVALETSSGLCGIGACACLPSGGLTADKCRGIAGAWSLHLGAVWRLAAEGHRAACGLPRRGLLQVARLLCRRAQRPALPLGLQLQGR